MTVCPNCQTENPESAVFCHNCSQKFNLGLLSVTRMISEFFKTLVNYDNKLFKSLRGLFSPGHLTKEYLAKRRVPYLTPMRLFVFLMFAFFAIVALNGYEKLFVNIGDDTVTSKDPELSDNRTYNLLEKSDSEIKLLGLTDSLKVELKRWQKKKEILPEKIQKAQDKLEKAKISSQYAQQLKSFEKQLQALQGKNIEAAEQALDDLIVALSLETDKKFNATIFGDRKIEVLYQDLNRLNEHQIIEKYKVTHWLEKIMVQQMIRFNQRPSEFGGFLFKNLTWAILLEVLLMSLIFKLFYIRQKRMYAEHFIFHLHLRSLLFFVGSLLMLLSLSWWQNSLTVTVLVLMAALYFFVSLRRIYLQSFIMTAIKMIVFTLFEFIVLLISVVFVVLVSSLLFR